MDKQLQRLRQVRERMPHYRGVLDLAEMLLSEKCRLKDPEGTCTFAVDPMKAKIQMEEGFPYLRPADVSLDASRVREYFSCLLRGWEEINPAKFQSLQKTMEKKNFVGIPFWNRLLQNQVSEGTLEEEFGPEGSLLFFFLVQSLKPFFGGLAKRWNASLKNLSWTQGYCPFCGGVAGMGEIRKEGERALHCLFCGTTWEYPRMKCPYCQNQDQNQLTYFQVEGEAENRVDICLACRHYLKTIDSRQTDGPLDFEVEDYLTLHLDHLAQDEGYIRPSKLFVDVHKN
jgi:formate dehydrogenase maturation protein FdhE